MSTFTLQLLQIFAAVGFSSVSDCEVGDMVMDSTQWWLQDTNQLNLSVLSTQPSTLSIKHLVTFNSYSNKTMPLLFNSENEALRIILIVIYYVLLIPVFGGNLLLIIATFKCKQLHTRTNTLVANSACSDMIFGTFLIVYEIILLQLKRVIPGQVLEVIYLIFFRTGISISLSNLLLITAERYFSVLWPFCYEAHVTNRSIIVGISLSWLVNIPLCTASWLLEVKLQAIKENLEEHPVFVDSTAYDYVWLAFCLLEFSLSIYFYARVICVSWRQLKTIHRNNSVDDGLARRDLYKAKRRSLFLGAFIVLWSPIFCFKILRQFCRDILPTEVLSRFGNFLVKLNYCINFIVYAATKTYRSAFKDLFCSRRVSSRVFVL